MIERYSRPEMARIWAAKNRFQIWLEIETLACEAQAELGVIPKEVVPVIRAKGDFDIARIDEIEAEVKHDVIAFLTSVSEHVGPEARFIHQGMTSSDVLDTCLSVQLTQAADELLADLDMVLESLKARALEHKDTVCIGRSHGIHAEPVTFGLKLASFTPRCSATGPAWLLPAKTSPPGPSPARSAPSPTSIPLWKNTSARKWGSGPSRPRPRLSRATVTAEWSRSISWWCCSHAEPCPCPC